VSEVKIPAFDGYSNLFICLSDGLVNIQGLSRSWDTIWIDLTIEEARRFAQEIFSLTEGDEDN